jgi:hypothetical protein
MTKTKPIPDIVVGRLPIALFSFPFAVQYPV